MCLLLFDAWYGLGLRNVVKVVYEALQVSVGTKSHYPVFSV